MGLFHCIYTLSILVTFQFQYYTFYFEIYKFYNTTLNNVYIYIYIYILYICTFSDRSKTTITVLMPRDTSYVGWQALTLDISVHCCILTNISALDYLSTRRKQGQALFVSLLFSI